MHLLIALLPLLTTFTFPHARSLLTPRADDALTVHLNKCTGSPQHYAAGLLYGISGMWAPPEEYYADLQINYQSSGGAQTESSPGGYAISVASYSRRFSTVAAAHWRIRRNDGVLVVKLADLWGADEAQPKNLPLPGDGGDWKKYEAFLTQVITDLKEQGMANRLTTQLELWNEPDVNFGGRPQKQLNEMFVRGIQILCAAFPKAGVYLPLVGPSTAAPPSQENAWWAAFLAYLKANGGTAVQPDVWSWHQETSSGDNDPVPPTAALNALLPKYSLTTGLSFQNDGYGTKAQQTPAYSAWFFARYERLKINALRGNWEKGNALHDNLADLLIGNMPGNGGRYATTGSYLVHKAYVNMVGAPCATTSGKSFDAYATATKGSVDILVGGKNAVGTVDVVVSSLGSYFGGASAVNVEVLTYPFHKGAPVLSASGENHQNVKVSNGQVTIALPVSAAEDAHRLVITPTTPA